MNLEDWRRLEASLARLDVQQIEQRLEVSPLLFPGSVQVGEQNLSLDCSVPKEPSPGKIPDPTVPWPWPTPTGPTDPEQPPL